MVNIEYFAAKVKREQETGGATFTRDCRIKLCLVKSSAVGPESDAESYQQELPPAA